VTQGVLINAKPAPVALLPTPFPKQLFNRSLELMPLFNSMTRAVAADVDFLRSSLAAVEDDFTHRLLDILTETTRRGPAQEKALGIFRSDYMLHDAGNGAPWTLHQVELNRISCAFPALSTFVSQMHRYLLQHFTLTDRPNFLCTVENQALDDIVDGIYHAWQLFGNQKAFVMMVVQEGEKNSADQRHIEYRLWNKHKVSLLRRSLQALGNRAALDDNRNFIIDGHTIAVAYFRAGYRPQDYPTDNEWAARLDLELSTAIKCPNINYHLCGTKKVQQVLAQPGVLERFVSSKNDVDLLRSCFAGLYSLDLSEADKIVPRVLADPRRYVMKPQREGGGNLLTGEKMVHALQTMKPEEIAAYIIMDRINTPAVDVIYMVNDELKTISSVVELGIYGVLIADNKTEYRNTTAGSLLRTKSATSEDGGVVAGVAVLDSVYLIDL
jgi:glutathione synthase